MLALNCALHKKVFDRRGLSHEFGPPVDELFTNTVREASESVLGNPLLVTFKGNQQQTILRVLCLVLRKPYVVKPHAVCCKDVVQAGIKLDFLVSRQGSPQNWWVPFDFPLNQLDKGTEPQKMTHNLSKQERK